MTIFCLDTSTRAGSMALWQHGAVSSVVHDDPRSHVERLPVEAMTWLAGEGVTLAGLDAFAVVAGPGSFTGLRVGVAAVQGWAFATGKPLITVPTLDAVAADSAVAGLADALIVPMIDGQRGEVFFSAWRNGAEVVPASVARPAEAVDAIRTAFPTEAIVTLGDGAARYSAIVEGEGWRRIDMAAPIAESAARLAGAGRYEPGPPHAARLIYVRRPDAVLTREKRHAR